MFKVRGEYNQLTNCCGVYEIGYLSDDEEDIEVWERFHTGETLQEAWTKALAYIQDNLSTGIVLQVWFMKGHNHLYEDFPAYNCEALRQLVQEIPGVLHLGEHRNPNSKNLIDGYMWVNK